MLDRFPDHSGLGVGPICILERPFQLWGLAPDVCPAGREWFAQNQDSYVTEQNFLTLNRDGECRQVGEIR